MLEELLLGGYLFLIFSSYIKMLMASDIVGKKYLTKFKNKLIEIRTIIRKIIKISMLGLIFVVIDTSFFKLDRTSFIFLESYVMALNIALYAFLINKCMILRFKVQRQIRKDKILYGN